MNPRSHRWKTVTTSAYPCEREALEHLQGALPDQDPYRVWTNFELTAADGSINEIDALVLTPEGLFLVEIKSHTGAISGDAGTWRFRQNGRVRVCENPRLLTNRKAKRLKSRLTRTQAFAKQPVPFISAVVFLSATNLDTSGLDATGRQGVFVRSEQSAEIQTPIAGLMPLFDGSRRLGNRIGAATAAKLDQAMEEIGIRPAQSLSRVGDYALDELLDDRESWQEWSAHHRSIDSMRRRIRIYHTLATRGSDQREALIRAAQRELLVLEGIDHPGIIKVFDLKEHELGPALLFAAHRDAPRLDHWLETQGATLHFDQRFYLFRQLAETVAFAHERRLVHRALRPRAILVDSGRGLGDPKRGAQEPQLVITDWHTGTRSPHGDTTVPTAIQATRHPDRLVDDDAGAFMAPEVRTQTAPDGVRADVFSLGALAYRFFTGQAPANDSLGLLRRLQEQPNGLDLSAHVDGVSPELAELVMAATHPDVDRRLASVQALIDGLEQVEAELTRPTVPAFDPERASIDDRLEHGIVLQKRLGHGGTAFVFKVEKDRRSQVLKIARSLDKNRYLIDEHEVLEELRHHGIVEVFERVEIAGRVGLLMADAGETLAARLRQDTRLSLDFLERWGADLLQIVQWLEEKGIAHRDLKPTNLGVKMVGRQNALHLVLFDFSLARVPLDRIELGTPAYLDPFLRRPDRGRFDSAAERFSAAMTLYEMTTGRLPTWGSGDGDPLFSEAEATIAAESFDPVVRAPLAAFFAQALARDHKARFDNAEQMLRAWRRAFLAADAPALPTAQDASSAAHSASDSLAHITLDTQIIELPLSARAFHALEKRSIADVRALVSVSLGGLRRQRGVGDKTRQEILDLVGRLRPRFPDFAAQGSDATPGRTETDTSVADAPSTHALSDPPAERALDALAKRLVPPPMRAKIDAGQAALRLLLGLDRPPGLAARPNQTDIAEHTGVTRARISQVLQKARLRWRDRLPALTAVREEIVTLLAEHGAVMSEDELAAALLVRRGTRDQSIDRWAMAHAVARAASEAERDRQHPRWLLRRKQGKLDRPRIVLSAIAGPVESGEASTGSERAEQAAQARAAWALRLGEAADALAGEEPLPAPSTVLDRLGALPPPTGTMPLAPSRIVHLAAACSQTAAVSSRAELYPRGLPPARALTLAAGVAHGVRALTPEALRSRVESRYPDAQPLPERPELDTLVTDSGLDLAWSPIDRVYVPRTTGPLLSSTASLTSRIPGLDGGTGETDTIDRRLARNAGVASMADAGDAGSGSWLVLRVDPALAIEAQRTLVARYGLHHVSFDRLLLDALRQVSDAANVDWSLVLRADAADSSSHDWGNLMRLLDRALPLAESALLATEGTVLLTEPGLLGRYDRLDLLERLREHLHDPGRRPRDDGTALRGLWILVPADHQHDYPTLAGRAVPILSVNDFVDIPRTWLQQRTGTRR